MEQRNSRQENNAQEVQEAALFSEIGNGERGNADKKKNTLPTPPGSKKVQEVRKDTDIIAGADTAANSTEPKDLLNKAFLMEFIMDYMKDPVDALTSYKLPGVDKILPEFMQGRFYRLVQQAAKDTGADPAQIANKETRTPEQDRALTEAAAREEIARLEAYLNTNYMQALEAVQPHETDTAKTRDLEDIIKHFAVLYFFALHFPDIQPQQQKALTEENIKEIKDILARLDFSLSEYQKNHNAEPVNDNILTLFNEFVEAENMTAKVQSNLPQLQSIMPKYHATPNTKLSNKIDSLINKGEGNLPVENMGKKSEIAAYIMVNYDSGAVTLPGTFTEYDRQVLDGICSLWEYGHESHIFTPAMVFRAMTGNPQQKPSAQQQGAVTKSIEKMRRIFATIDATDEVRAYLRRRGVVDVSGVSMKWNDALLSLKAIETRNGKQKIRAYYMNTEPILLSYSKAVGKILTARTDLLDVKEIGSSGQITDNSLSNTEGHIAIKGYLWRRVLMMRHDEKAAADALRKYENRRKRDKTLEPRSIADFRQQQRIVSFDTLFSETGQNGTSREMQRKNRNYAFQVLDFWKAKGLIKGYEQQTGTKSGRAGITGVKIDV